MRTTLLALVALLAAGCRKPDTGRPDTGGPLVVVATPDAAPATPLPPPGPVEGAYCVENWRVTIPARARLFDVAWADNQTVLLLEQDGTWIAVAVGGGGQSTAAVLQDFVPDFVAGRSPFGRLVAASGRALALYGWVKPREAAALYGRVVKPDGSLNPSTDGDASRRRYFVAQPRPDWDLAGDPVVPESRIWTAGVENRFLVLLDLWLRDKLEAGQVQPVKKHTFSIFGGTGKRAGGWDLRASRGAGPAVLADRVILAVSGNDRKWELLDTGGRRQTGPLLDALNTDLTLIPLGGGCLPGAAPAADGGIAQSCFVLLAPPEPPAAGLPTIRALAGDGTPMDWRVPPDLGPTSTFEAVADGMLWALAPDGSVWAAGPDGVVAQRTVLPEGAVLRRYSRQELLVAVNDASGRTALVVSCVPGGAQPAPARGVALDGTVAQARRDAAGLWNESALASLDAIQEQLATAALPDEEHQADLATFDDVRRMAARARTLDPEILVAALTSARAEVLYGDTDAARRELAAVDAAEPSRRERLRRLACTDARFAALRWSADLGPALGCPEPAPEWFAVRASGLLPGADVGLVVPSGTGPGPVMPGADLVDAGEPPIEDLEDPEPPAGGSTVPDPTGSPAPPAEGAVL